MLFWFQLSSALKVSPRRRLKLGVAVVADDADIERVGGGSEVDLGPLGGRLSGIGVLLDEPAGWCDPGPGRVVENITVEGGGITDDGRGRQWAGPLVQRLSGDAGVGNERCREEE